MTLTQIRYFVAIADAGLNITQAAERVHATQPGLSKQLKQLEEQLGFLLFSRKGRSLDAITPAGQQVLTHARRMLDEAASIAAYAANQRGDRQGRLVLATTHTQARFVLPATLARIRLAYPQLSVHLQPAAEGEVLKLLASGEADLALISSAGDVPAGGLAVPLYRWRRVLLVPAQHPLAEQAPPDIVELASLPLISYESSTRADSSLRRAFSDAGVEPNLAMTARDADLIKTYVRAGLGVGLLAEMALLDDDNDLRALPAPTVIPECVAWAVLPRERVLREYTLDLLIDLAPQLDRVALRQTLAGNISADWPEAPPWGKIAAALSVAASSAILGR